MGACLKLDSLDFSYNNSVAFLPDTFVQFPALHEFDASSNQFSLYLQLFLKHARF
eukprot:m.22986 g.22986  ORF g.22986 m.22986 type:complete len:55 (-) comp13062_c0_seq2:875-1039(-)